MGYKAKQFSGTIGSVEDAFGEIDNLKEEMSSWKDNMEEKLSHTEKYSAVSDCADELAVEVVDIPDGLSEFVITYYEMVPTRKKQQTSRATRLSNAAAILSAAAEEARAIAERIENGEETCDSNPEDIIKFADDLDEVVGKLDSVDFPGMFG